ncbi:DUF4044 domain-containing protein [Enterococcus faecalis]|uniref:DUF4044 domain-containing protein n=1 Tax=Enterococcus faecalis TaxID=1351 RepID=A0A974NZH9_ENTFL|nr:DUF4044 domain-containing protein [Enterococcus faecalis]
MYERQRTKVAFSKITKVVVWLMLIAIVGSTVLTAILSL